MTDWFPSVDRCVRVFLARWIVVSFMRWRDRRMDVEDAARANEEAATKNNGEGR